MDKKKDAIDAIVKQAAGSLQATKNVMIPCAKFAGKTFVQIEGLHQFLSHLQKNPDINKNMNRGIEKVKNTLNSLHASAKNMQDIPVIHATKEQLEQNIDD